MRTLSRAADARKRDFYLKSYGIKMQSGWIRRPKGGTPVVFVHGILSSGEACWRHENGTYWPELLKNEAELEALGIYVFTYQTGIFSGSYRLGDVVDALKEHMRLDGLLDSQRIIFVCHSMGGIVVRKFLVERATDLIERKIEIGVFLVASPSLGSSYANWLSPLARLFGHAQADALRFEQDNAWLNDLDKEFQNLKEARKLTIQGKELIEDKFIVLKKILRKQVVEPFAGARYFGEPFKVSQSDHISIAKPQTKDAIQHRLLCQFIKSMLELSVDSRTREAETPSEEERPPPFMAPKAFEYMLGRGESLKNLTQRLLNSTGRTVTLLMQFPGVGKSELAAFLANDEDVKKHYGDGVLWAPLGKNPDVKALLSEWAQELKIPPEEMTLAGSTDARIRTINRYIGNKRILLIVDDAWNNDHITPFRDIGARCDLVVTTRSIQVAGDLVRGPVTEENGIFRLKALGVDDGLALLEFLAPNAIKKQKEKGLARELVQLVESLPLALFLMGRYLAGEASLNQPRRISGALHKLRAAEKRLSLKMKRLPGRPEDQPRTLMAAIDMSVEELDDEARQALYMLSVILPKPYRFSNKDAEGMFGIEYESLNKLVDAGLLEVAKPDDGKAPGGSAAADQENLMEEDEEEAPEYYQLPRTIADYAQAQLTPEQLQDYHHKAVNYFASLLREYEEERTGDATSYERMYSYERPAWQAMKAAWLYHQAQTSDRTEANLNMAQIYFDAFWWWRCYNKEFPFCDQILNEWRETQTSDVDRKWLAQLTKFQEAYPTGYEKQDKGDWHAVEAALLEIRRLGGMDWKPGALPPPTSSSCDKTAGRLHVRAITNFFLAESYRYRAVNDQRADELYDETVRIFREHLYAEDDDWNLPWAYWHLADLALERGQGEEALEMAAESLRLERETSEEIFDKGRDNEVIANDYRVGADVRWQHRELELAFQNYALAVFYAYLFQCLPKCPDFYTADFYLEMTTRTRNRLAELWADGQKDAALQACAYLREFWKPYWELEGSSSAKVDYQALLEAGELAKLESVLFPRRPAEHDRHEDSEYVRQARKVTEAIRDPQARAQQVNQIVRAI